MSAILLIEDMSSDECGMIQESTNDGKNLWLGGTFMQAGIKNRNGRVYPLQEMITAVNSANIVIKENGGIFGELDHPQSLSINSDRISHAITELRLEGNNVYGKAKILPTPMGIIAKALIESGVKKLYENAIPYSEDDDKKDKRMVFNVEIGKCGNIIGEDVFMCNLWKSLDEKVYLDTTITVGHIGDINFTGDFQTWLNENNYKG